MNLILEKSAYVDVYTDLAPILDAVPELTEYWYLVTDVEINRREHPLLEQNPLIVHGGDLAQAVAKEDVQFEWAVLSAFKNKPLNLPARLPFADGNAGFWTGSPRPQLSAAAFEVVFWDSTATLFIGVPDSISNELRKRYPDIKDLG